MIERVRGDGGEGVNLWAGNDDSAALINYRKRQCVRVFKTSLYKMTRSLLTEIYLENSLTDFNDSSLIQESFMGLKL